MGSKILIASCLCLVGFAGFFVSTGNADKDDIMSKFKQTSNGSYMKKYVRVSEVVGVDGDGNETKSTVISADVPGDKDLTAWKNYLQASEMSDTRRAIVLEALDTIEKGCIYHQLRGGSESPTRCYSGDDCDKQSLGAYDFTTQAKYNVQDPLYLDCSYFVKHCYAIAGLEMSSTTTSGLYGEGEFTSIQKTDMIPGDIGVRQGHTKLFLGLDASGIMTWAELSNHANDSIVSQGDLGASYKYKRFGALANDTKFVGGKSAISTTTTVTGNNNQPGTQQVAWSDSWEFADPQMKHPAALNKYVPDNYNGHTVFLNAGHGSGAALSSVMPNDPVGNLTNQYKAKSSGGFTGGTSYTTSAGKKVSEAQYTLNVALKAKDGLLSKGYAVVMAREDMSDQIENAARSVFANNTSDIHVAIHIDAGTHGPGWYRPDAAEKNHSNYKKYASQAEKLGTSIENAVAQSVGKSVFTGLSGVLTGYNYSTIPCVYIELYGVQSKEMADFADSNVDTAAQGIVNGIDAYFN